jgi:hypothetical protein
MYAVMYSVHYPLFSFSTSWRPTSIAYQGRQAGRVGSEDGYDQSKVESNSELRESSANLPKVGQGVSHREESSPFKGWFAKQSSWPASPLIVRGIHYPRCVIILV